MTKSALDQAAWSDSLTMTGGFADGDDQGDLVLVILRPCNTGPSTAFRSSRPCGGAFGATRALCMLVGYFEGIDSERGLEWRCSDATGCCWRCGNGSPWYRPRTRAACPMKLFDWPPALIAEAGLVKGERIGVDASTMEANAACATSCGGTRARVTGGCWSAWLSRHPRLMARLDRKRKGKKLSNQDWVSKRPRGQDRQDGHDPSGLA